jgi:hypothetical protein
MKRSISTVVGILLLSVLISSVLFAASHKDPAVLQVVSVENAPTIDGKLDETEWERRYDHLVFSAAFGEGDVEYAVTEGNLVDGTYDDSTTTIVKVLHDGLDLYMSLSSNDQYVNKWGGSWEGDGLFMKVQKADLGWVEFKLFFNAAGDDPDIVYESNAPEGSGEGAAYKLPGTIVNDTSAVDSGYTAELVIHLDKLGYKDPYADVPVLINIFDPDGQTGAAGEENTIGSYYKIWWGSEWGPVSRILRLSDPPVMTAYMTKSTINLDGQLNESFWIGAESIVVAKQSNMSTGGWYMQWGDPLNEIDDPSESVIKFIHNGTDVYIGIESNDSSVCAWSPGWEGDGFFSRMVYKDMFPAASSDNMGVNLMYNNQTIDTCAILDVSSNAPTGLGEGVSYEPPGTVTHTEANGPDAGYSMEIVIHTGELAYSVLDTFMLAITMWDMDFASVDAWTDGVSDYIPDWWGTQWAAPDFEKYYLYRGVWLSNQILDNVDESPAQIARTFSLSQNYPNPFNPSTTIDYSVPTASQVDVEVFDILGRKVATLFSGKIAAGNHQVVWNGTNDTGQFVSNGVYFYKIRTADFSQTRKMILMK